MAKRMIKNATVAILLLMIVSLSLSVAGCTSINNTTQTPMTATQRAAFLENYLAAYKNETYSNNGEHVKAWELDWINSTSARVQVTEQNKTTNQTMNYNETFVAFPTRQDATDYVNAVNLTAYSIASTAFTGGPYENVTGHATQLYKVYYYLPSENEVNVIYRLDNLAVVQTGKTLN